MGKKKREQGGQSGDFVPGDDIDALVADINNDTITENKNVTKKAKGKKKKQQLEDDNWEDDILNEIADLQTSEGKSATNDETKVEKIETDPKEQPGEDFYIPSDEENTKKSKKGKKKKKPAAVEVEKKEEQFDSDGEPIIVIKTKAQKLAEKKERERKKREQQKQNKPKQQTKTSAETSKLEDEAVPPHDEGEHKPETVEESDQKVEDKNEPLVENEENDKTSKKKKKKKKGAEAAEKTEKKKKPNKSMLKAMKDQLLKQQEEEKRLQQEDEERIRREEAAEEERIKKIEEEKLKKERKKQKEKDRKLRLKEEGKWMTAKQKEAARKNAAYLESLREQGLIPNKEDVEEKKKKPIYANKKKKVQKPEPDTEEVPSPVVEDVPEVVEEEMKEEEPIVEEESDDGLDNWEEIADNDELVVDDVKLQRKTSEDVEEEEETSDDESEQSSDDEDDSESSSEEEESEDNDEMNPRERALLRIEKRKEENELKRTIDVLRCPVVCVMGHVDTGKTKILDKIRRSHVQDGEAGGITQQIGATNIPEEAIRNQTSMVKSFQEFEMRFPGLLVIDTPGHESFSNLRSRGSSVCDMAILVVDIMHGLEPQTIESIKMLKKRKTPFIVALNKVDRLYEWKRGPDSDVVNTLKKQKRHTKDEFDEHVNNIIVQFAQQELNVKLFHENKDPSEWISMVPTSAHSGDGMGNLIALLCQLCQTTLTQRLAYSEELSCTVLEVKAIQGLGTTIDVILTNGKLHYGDKIVLAGVEGPIVTHIKALLMPQPLKELRVKNPYDKFDKLVAAQGVKILAKDLDKALAGTQLLVAHQDDEVEILKEEVQAEVEKTLKAIKLQERGVFVQASTLGSLEALLAFLKTSKIPYAGINIGPVHKKDIMKASVMLEHDSQWAVILAFDVKVEREAQEMAEHLGVTIFTADIIYHLFDKFTQHREDLRKRKQEEYRQIAVFPCKLKIVPNCVFKSRDPIIIGVNVVSGQLRPHTPICVPDKEFCFLGRIASIEFNHKPVDIARAGQEICIKIEGVPGDAPKMVGRHFEEADVLVSKINRDSIDALKNWFRDEMTKADWQLIIELKKSFEIL